MTGTNERYERQQLHRRLQRMKRKLFLRYVSADKDDRRHYVLQPASSANNSVEFSLHPASLGTIGEKENMKLGGLQNESQIKVQPQ
jgi:hypothetical protein